MQVCAIYRGHEPHGPHFPAQREAKLRYLDHEFEMITPGDFVRCAVTGDPIRLDELALLERCQAGCFQISAESFSDYLKARDALNKLFDPEIGL